MNNKEYLGQRNEGVDQYSSTHVTDAFYQQELQSARPPIDNSMPSIQPQPYQPDIMTQVVDTNSQTPDSATPTDVGIRSGVYSSPYQVETFEQWEARIRREQKDNFVTRSSHYMQSPVTSGAPNVQDTPKPTPKELDKVRTEHRRSYLDNELRVLDAEERKLRAKLNRVLERRRDVQQRVEDFN